MATTDRSKPLEGRCNAKTQAGYCHARPKAGTTRCRIHGGQQQTWSARMHALDDRARAEVDAALADPDLLDVRRPIALADALVGRTPLLPSEETVTSLARRRILRDMSPEQLRALRDSGPDALELLDPTDGDLDAVRLELHERSMRIVALYSRRQVDAVKQLEWTKVIREAALPLFGEFGLRISRLIRKYVPEDKVEAAIADVRKEVRQTIGELALLKDAAK